MMRTLLIFAFLTFFYWNSILAAIITSTTSGDFQTGTTWIGGVAPTSSDTAIIANGHSITFSANTTLSKLTVDFGGILNNNGYSLTLQEAGAGDGVKITINGEYAGSGGTTINASLYSTINKLYGTGIVSTSGNWTLANDNLTIDSTAVITFTQCSFSLSGSGSIHTYGNVTFTSGSINTSGVTSAFIKVFEGSVLTLTSGSINLSTRYQVANYGTITVGGDITGTNATTSKWYNYANSTLNITGVFLTTGTVTANYSGNTVNYNSSGNQSIRATQYYHLTLSNAGNKSTSTNSFILGNLSIEGNAQFTANIGTMYIGGNWSNTSTHANSFDGSTTCFNGTAPQTISSNRIGGEVFDDVLTLNNTSGGVTLVNCNIKTISITFTSGVLHTGSNEAIVDINYVFGFYSMYGYSPASYIDGNLRRGIDPAGGIYDFPIGNSDSYQLATLNIASGNNVGSILGKFSNVVTGTGFPLVESGNTYNSLLDCGGTTTGTGNAHGGIWTFTPAAGSADYDLTLTATNYSNEGSVNTIGKRSDSSSAWQLLGTSGSRSEVNDTLTVSRTGYSGFSDFAILTAITPLPIELSTVSAKCQKSKNSNNEYGATIQWTTESEKNNDYFIVEESNNGILWENLDTMDGSGTSYLPMNYYFHKTFINPAPENESVLYFRVSQTDFDGVVKKSEILSCKCEASDKIKIHPIPATEFIVINFGDQNNVPNSFQITDMFGRLIEDISIAGGKEGNTSFTLDISKYASGRYLIKINDWKMKEDAVFIKE